MRFIVTKTPDKDYAENVVSGMNTVLADINFAYFFDPRREKYMVYAECEQETFDRFRKAISTFLFGFRSGYRLAGSK